MRAPLMHGVATSNDRAEILGLIHSRHNADHWNAGELHSRNLAIKLGTDYAFSQGLVCVSGVRNGTDSQDRFWLRETLWFQRKVEGWRIVDEQRSGRFQLDVGAYVRSSPMTKLRVDWSSADAELEPCR